MGDGRCLQCRTHGSHVHIQLVQYIKHFDSDYYTIFCFNWKSVNSFFGNLKQVDIAYRLETLRSY